jgi:hypothetical protein
MEETTKVIKCGECNKFFGWTKSHPGCPFCHTVLRGEISEVEEEQENKDEGKKVFKSHKNHKKHSKIW